jgi:hypothetical protein
MAFAAPIIFGYDRLCGGLGLYQIFEVSKSMHNKYVVFSARKYGAVLAISLNELLLVRYTHCSRISPNVARAPGTRKAG